MVKRIIRRTARDNVYLHKDFHGALSAGIEYLDQTYGPDAVRAYLRQFATAFYAPLTRAVMERGLVALKEHYERIYQLEGGQAQITLSEDEMVLRVQDCPAVAHMRKQEYPVARLFYETTKTVNEAICEGTPFASELVEYDERTGHSTVRYFRRKS